MGRSQVLYNRTKGGRGNKNRSGRGQQGNPNSEDSGSGRTKTAHHPRQPQHQPSRLHSKDYSLDRPPPKDYEHEYEVLFAGRTTYLSRSSSNSKGNTTHGDNHDEEQLMITTGSICIHSMAATLESMSITKRLRIPLRVAAKAFPDKFRATTTTQTQTQNNNSINQNTNNEEKETDHKPEPKASQQQQRTQEEPVSSSAPLETNESTVSDHSSSNLDDWLDDACGIVDDSQGLPQKKIAASAAAKKLVMINDASNNNAASGDSMLAKAEEEYGDDNLDDWLDSVIE